MKLNHLNHNWKKQEQKLSLNNKAIAHSTYRFRSPIEGV